jgi:hypothetical protein
VYVSKGDTNADTMWTCTSDATITLGSSDVVFVPAGCDAAAVTYTPDDPTDWNVEPTTAQEALDELADRVKTAEGSLIPTQSFVVACSGEIEAITSGSSKVTFRVPYAFTLTAVRASLVTAQTSGSIFTVDVNEGGTSILSTKLTIDNTEKTSTTAATPPVISDSAIADDAEITIDVDQAGTGPVGLIVTLIGTRSV